MEANIRDVHVERYYPNTVNPAKEFQVIAEAENPELVKVWKAIWRWMLNAFVMDIDEAGAKRWEEMLNIRPRAEDSLESRKAVILAKINASLPYTYRRLEQILNTICGEETYQILLNHIKCEFGLRVFEGAKSIEKLCGILRPIIPANLDMFLEIVREMTLKYSVGIVNITAGKKQINLPNVPDCQQKIYTGIGYLRAGKVGISTARPPKMSIKIYVGTLIRRTGKITIGGIR